VRLGGGAKKDVFCLASCAEVYIVRAFSDSSVWSVAQAMNRREKGRDRNKLKKVMSFA
jgi:hypothetical protein